MFRNLGWRSLRFEHLEDRRLLTADAGPAEFVQIGDTVFFTAEDEPHGRELWKTDGTPGATELVEDIMPGPDGSISLGSPLVVAGGKLFFSADDGVNGKELWVSDGTPGGTTMVRDIVVGDGGSMPEDLTAFGGSLFFTADDGVGGRELWASDGTSGTTQPVDDIFVGSEGSDPSYLTESGGTLFFVARDVDHGAELWKMVGVGVAPELVKDIRPGPGTWLGAPDGLVDVNGMLYFAAKDTAGGKEPWVSDGTDTGTTQVKDIHPGVNGSYPQELTNVAGVLFFSADDGATGRELFKSDGTDAGTSLVRDIHAESSSSFPENLTDVNGTLYFTATDGVHGIEPWKSDGQFAGTSMVRDIFPGDFGSDPGALTAWADTLFFQAADPTSGRELWTSTGTEAGTTLFEDIRPGTRGSNPAASAVIGDRLYFQADDGTHGVELWTSDGTPAATTMLLDLNTGPAVRATFATDKAAYETGELVALEVEVLEDGLARTGAAVVVTVTAPAGSADDIAPVVLHDDGSHGDGMANDGVYANVFRRAVWPGTYGFDLNASGRDRDGEAFQLGDTLTVSVSAGFDSDGDLMTDVWETREGTNLVDVDANVDLDGDTVANLDEFYGGTMPAVVDTDLDGFADDVEPKQNTDPLTPDNLPAVLTTSPVHGGPMVRLDVSPEIFFDRAMAPATLTDQTIVATGSLSGRHQGTVSYDAEEMSATFDPDADFLAGELVTLVVTTGVRSAEDRQPATDDRFTFHADVPKETEGEFAPRVLGSSPVHGGPKVALDADVTVWFDADIDILTLDATTFVVEGGVGGSYAGNVTYDAASRSATFSAFDDFAHGEDITVTVTTDVYGLNGLPLESPGTFMFHTLPAPVAGVAVPAPSVLATTPVHGGPKVDPGTSIELVLDMPIEKVSLDGGNVAIVGTVSGTHDAYGVIYNEETRTATLLPDDPFAFAEDVTVTVTTNVMGLDGQPLAAEHQFLFHTIHQTPVETDSPEVLATSPANGGPMVNLTANIDIDFNTAMDLDAFTDATIVLVGSAGGPLSATYFYNSDTRRLSINPNDDFAHDEDITVTVKSTLADDDGDTLAGDYVFQFHTVPETYTPTPIPGGTIDQDTTWTASGSPYLIAGDLTIGLGVTLTVEAGTVVKFDAVDDSAGSWRYRNGLIVEGTLDLQGTEDSRVVFTSSRDTLYGGDAGASGSLAPGNWGSIKYTNPNNVLDHALVRYGGLGGSTTTSHQYEQMVWAAGSEIGTLEIRDSILEHAWNRSVFAESGQSPLVEGNTVRDSVGEEYSIHLEGSGTIRDNTVLGCQKGIYLEGANGTVQGNRISGTTYALGVQGGTVTDNALMNSTYALYQGTKADPVYSGNTFTNIAHPVICTSGALASDLAWDDVQGMGWSYLIEGDLTVAAGTTLTIPAGIVVKFEAVDDYTADKTVWRYRNDLIVEGTLDLLGTADERVVFTSSRDDLYGGDSDGAGGNPSPGNWGAIKYTNPSNILHDAVVRYGGLGAQRRYYSNGWRTTYHDEQMVWAVSSDLDSLVIRDSVLERSFGRVIYVESLQTPTIMDNTVRFAATDAWAIELDGNGNLLRNTVVDCDFGMIAKGASSTVHENRLSGISSVAVSVTGGNVTDNRIMNAVYPLAQGVLADPVYAGNEFTNVSHHVVRVAGTLEADFEWDDVQGMGWPYLVVDDVIVSGSRTLTIPAGIVVKFEAVDDYTQNSNVWRYRNDLIVEGTLDLLGTEDVRIVFTSSRDDLYGGDSDGTGGNPSPGNWGAIKYTNPSNILRDAVVRYGGLGAQRRYYGNGWYTTYHDEQMVWAAGDAAGALEIRDCVLEYPYQNGIYAEPSQSPWVHDNQLRNGRDVGRGISVDGAGVIEDNVVVRFTNGIRSGGSDTSISGNRILSASDLALSTDGGAVTDNDVLYSTFAIRQGNKSDPVYSGNRFREIDSRVILVGGSLETDFEWEDVQQMGWPYLLTEDVIIPGGGGLTIPSGIVVKFDAVDNYTQNSNVWRYRNDLIVEGTLDLLGTEDERVIFTSSRDDLYGGDSDGAGGNPGPGNWGAIKYANPSNILHDAVVRYGGLGAQRRYYSSGWYTTYHDEQMVWAAGSIEIRDTVMEDAWKHTIYVATNEAPWIHDNIIHGDNNTGVFLDGPAVVENNTVLGTSIGIDARVGGVVIDGNRVVRGDGAGIALRAGGTLANNTVRLCSNPVYQTGANITYGDNVFADNVRPVIELGETFSRDAHLVDVQDLHLPYWIGSSLTVGESKSLAIDGGVVLKFNDGGFLLVEGELDPRGDEENPVVFTSYRDDEHGGDSNGDGPSIGQRGDWQEIGLNSSDSAFDHALVMYAGADGQAVHVDGNSSPRIEHVTVTESAGQGIRAESGSDALVTSSLVFDNDLVGIGCWSGQLRNNRVFNNTDGGILVEGGTSGTVVMSDNLVFNNGAAGGGIRIEGGAQAGLVNNTVYQPEGNAIQLTDGAQNVSLRNNVLWALDGYGVHVADDSRSGFLSDYNDLVPGTGGSAVLGSFEGDRNTLSEWRSATGLDVHSKSADPGFMDPDGADNVLGTTDDNFHLSHSSPAIDSANRVGSPPADLEGFGRWDDPGVSNTGGGTPDYVDMGAFEFQGDSTDIVPPTVVDIPTLPPLGEDSLGGFDTIVVEVSEPLDTMSAASGANFELRGDGADDLFDTADDTLHVLTPDYTFGATSIDLVISTGVLPPETYRLTLVGSDSILDVAGNRFDGDGNGVGGDDHARVFSVVTELAVSMGDVSVLEGDAGTSIARFTVHLSGINVFPVHVEYTTIDWSATAGEDYEARSGGLDFAVGQTEQTVDITIHGDQEVEPWEVFHIELTEATNAVLADRRGAGTIIDDDSPGAIRGAVWNDEDADGVWDGNEAGLAGRTVFLDQNENGRLDGGEWSAVTDSQGDYAFLDLPIGTYHVAREVEAGWRAVWPAGETHEVVIDPGEEVSGIHFGSQVVPELMEILVEFTDTEGLPVSQLSGGQPFHILVSARDLRTDGDDMGVYSAFADVIYDTLMIDVTGIEHLDPFTSYTSGTISDPDGLVDEAGGANGLTSPGSRGFQPLFYLEAIASSEGTLTIQTAAGEVITSENVLFGRDDDVRALTLYGTNEIQIFGEADLVSDSFDVINDHLLAGRANIDFRVRNAGSGPSGPFEVAVVLSDDDIIGNSDDVEVDRVVVGSLAVNAFDDVSVMVQLPVALLHARALQDDPPGQGLGYISTSFDYVGLAIDPSDQVAETNETNNVNQGDAIDKDDVTYFPWDVYDQGTVAPGDALYVINRMGQEVPPAEAEADLDGNGWVTPREAMQIINRIGYLINDAVLLDTASSAGSVQEATDTTDADGFIAVAEASERSSPLEPVEAALVVSPPVETVGYSPKAGALPPLVERSVETPIMEDSFVVADRADNRLQVLESLFQDGRADWWFVMDGLGIDQSSAEDWATTRKPKDDRQEAIDLLLGESVVPNSP